MSFIENFRAITPNRLPNNSILKPPVPAFERQKNGFTMTPEQRSIDSQIRNEEKQKQWALDDETYGAASNSTRDIMSSTDPAFNLVFKDKDVIKNSDALTDVLNTIGAQDTWDKRIDAARKASRKFQNSNGVTSWFNLIGNELSEMKDQVDASNGEQEIDPSYFLDSMKLLLKAASLRNKSTLI